MKTIDNENFYTAHEVSIIVKTNNLNLIWDILTEYIFIDGLVNLFPFKKDAIKQINSDFQNDKNKLKSEEYFLQSFDTFMHSKTFNFQGIFGINKYINESPFLIYQTKFGKINGENDNFKNYYFAPRYLESFIKSVKIPNPEYKYTDDSEKEYKYIGENEYEKYLHSFSMLSNGLNIFYYHESEIKKKCSQLNLIANFKAITDIGISKTTEHNNQKNLSKPTLINHGAIVYALIQNNVKYLHKNGEINRQAVINEVLKHFEKTNYTKSSDALDRALRVLINEIENASGIAQQKTKQRLSEANKSELS